MAQYLNAHIMETNTPRQRSRTMRVARDDALLALPHVWFGLFVAAETGGVAVSTQPPPPDSVQLRCGDDCVRKMTLHVALPSMLQQRPWAVRPWASRKRTNTNIVVVTMGRKMWRTRAQVFLRRWVAKRLRRTVLHSSAHRQGGPTKQQQNHRLKGNVSGSIVARSRPGCLVGDIFCDVKRWVCARKLVACLQRRGLGVSHIVMTRGDRHLTHHHIIGSSTYRTKSQIVDKLLPALGRRQLSTRRDARLHGVAHLGLWA